jgi:signal peptidase I
MAADAGVTVVLPKRRLNTPRLLGWARTALIVALAVFWFVALRPQVLGGPAGYALVSGTSMNPIYHTGDIVIVHRQANYHVGEIVAYIVPKGSAGAGAQVIHRLVGGNERKGFIVQGDNRTAPDVWHPRRAEIVGTAWIHIPKAGIVIVFLHTPAFLASLAAAITAGFFVLRSGKKPGPVTPD